VTSTELHPEGNLQVYLDKTREIEQEIQKLETDLAMSEEVANMRDSRGWQLLADRFRSVATDSAAPLRKRELSSYLQGWHQGRLDILDNVLRVEPLTPQEIDVTQQRITMLRDQLAEYQEVLR